MNSSFKRFLKRAYYDFTAVLLGILIPANVAMYRTYYRNWHTKEMLITYKTPVMDAVKRSGAASLELRVKDVFNESIDFTKPEINDKFEEQLFGYLEKRVGNVRGQSLSLEEKIAYARMFSSSLDYNYDTDWIKGLSGDKIDLRSAFTGMYEFFKINNMSVDELVSYKNVVCGHFSEVFAAALHTLNDQSTNREELHVGLLSFVPNHNSDYGWMTHIMAPLNALAFGEYRSQTAHVIDIVVTSKSFYLIEPQDSTPFFSSNPEYLFNEQVLDMNKDYAKYLLR